MLIPLNYEQLEYLNNSYDESPDNPPFRVVYNDCSVNLVTGRLSRVGDACDIIYYEREPGYALTAKTFLEQNNPGKEIRIEWTISNK